MHFRAVYSARIKKAVSPIGTLCVAVARHLRCREKCITSVSQIEALLKGLWGQVAEGGMKTLPIVVDFNKFKQLMACLSTGLKVRVMNKLGFERAEETFHGALSKQLPLPLILTSIPCLANKA
jgi:hypothetical protein